MTIVSAVASASSRWGVSIVNPVDGADRRRVGGDDLEVVPVHAQVGAVPPEHLAGDREVEGETPLPDHRRNGVHAHEGTPRRAWQEVCGS
jgi:hypothetical protein